MRPTRRHRRKTRSVPGRAGRILLATLAVLGLGLGHPAPAQEAAPGEGQEMPGAHVLVVDFGRVMRESAAAQSIAAQIATVRAAAQEEFGAIEDELVRIQAELTSQRSTLPIEQFEEKRRDFERRFSEAQRAAEARRAAIDAAETGAVARVRAALIEVVAQIAEDRGADIVVDRGDVIVVSPDFDVSQLALERLDAALPDVEVRVRIPGGDTP